MHAWHGRASSLPRVNPIYSEGEDAIAGRSKASSSGYGSQRGSGGGSYNGRAPPSSSSNPQDDFYVSHSTYSGRPFGLRAQLDKDNIYQTASEIYASRYRHPKINHGFLNAVLRGKDDDFKDTSGRDTIKSNFLRRDDIYLRSWNGKSTFDNSKYDGYLNPRKSFGSKNNINIISKEYEYLQKLEGSSGENTSSDTYDVINNNTSLNDDSIQVSDLPIVNFLPRVKSKEVIHQQNDDNRSSQSKLYDDIKEEDTEDLDKEVIPSMFFDSLNADPFLLYSRFIEENDDEVNKNEDTKSCQFENRLSNCSTGEKENAYTTIVEVHKTRNGDNVNVLSGLENSTNVNSDNGVSEREEYLKALLQDVAVALDSAMKIKKVESQGGMLEEARERVAMGLIALRKSDNTELQQLSVALSREPAKAATPMNITRILQPPLSPHSKRPSLWQQYYMKAQSISSLDSMHSCLSQVRPEAQFTLGVAAERRLAAALANNRKTRRVCRIVSIFLALFFFMLSIVLCSMLLTNGRATFGSMM